MFHNSRYWNKLFIYGNLSDRRFTESEKVSEHGGNMELDKTESD